MGEHKPLEQRIPVVIAGLDGISGVTAWSFRLREILADHPEFRIILTNNRNTGNKMGHFDYDTPSKHAVRSLLREIAPAIVVPNFIWPIFDICAELIAEGDDLRCVGFCRADSAEEYYNPLRWYEPIIESFCAVSPECAERLGQWMPERVDDISTMPTGVYVPQELKREYQTNPIRLIYGGRVVQLQKRVMDFVPLAENLLTLGVDFVFDIAGQGRDLEQLRKAVAASPAAKRFHFLGKKNPQDMPELWAMHDVFIQTSDFEGTSNSMLEAMAQGTIPVVTETESGARNVVTPGQEGVLVPIGDMEAMAQAIAHLAANQALIERMGQAAHEKAKLYSMESYAAKFIEILQRTWAAPARTWPISRPRVPEVEIHGLDLPEEWPLPKNSAKPTKPPIVIVTASDENYVMPLATMVKSLLVNLSEGENVALYILDGGISEKSKYHLLESWESPNLEVQFCNADLSLLEGLKITGHVNALTYCRLLIPFLLPESTNKAIYLDADMVVRGNVAELWYTPMDGQLILAVQDITVPYMDSRVALTNAEHCLPYLSAAEGLSNYRELGIRPQAKYFNAGLLVMDLCQWRLNKTAESVLAYLADHKEHVRYWDQDGLNALLHDQWGELDLEWNQQPHIYRYPSAECSPFPADTFQRTIYAPKLIHYSARSKPWHSENAHPWRNEFFEYVDKTAWRGWRPQPALGLLHNNCFQDWADGLPAEWTCTANARIERTGRLRTNDTAVCIYPHPNGVDTHLSQVFSIKPGQGRMVAILDTRADEAKVLGYNVYVTVDGITKAHTANHPSPGMWRTLRLDLKLPNRFESASVRFVIVLRKHATQPAWVENARLLLLPERDIPSVQVASAPPTIFGRLADQLSHKIWRAGITLAQTRLHDHTHNQAPRIDPTFSVILANYNGARYLGEAIESVLQQTYPHFELILVDDGSTDGSTAQIQEMAQKNPAIVHALCKPQNEGQGLGMTDGFRACNSDIVTFIDSDDLWFPDKLEKLARMVTDHPGAALYQHNLLRLQDGQLSEDMFRDVVYFGDLFAYVQRTRYFPYFVPTSGLAIPRHVLEHILPVPAGFRTCADGYLTRTAMCYGLVVSSYEAWGAYRIHEANNVCGNASHNSQVYRNTLLIPALNRFYEMHGFDFAFDTNLPKKRIHPSMSVPTHSPLDIILDFSLRKALRWLKKKVT